MDKSTSFHERNGLWRADPVLFAHELLKVQLLAFQMQALNLALWYGVLNCARQAGKTFAMAIKAVHLAFTVPGTTVVVLAATDKQVGRFFKVVKGLLGRLCPKLRGDGVHEYSLVLHNGSELIGLSAGAKFRGQGGVHLLLIDEAAEVPDEAYHAVTPMLARTAGHGAGGIWMMSTPQGKRGFFWDTWSEGGSEWARISVPASAIPHYSKEFLDQERQRKGDLIFRQEYCCEFLDTPDSLFREDLIRRAIRKNVPRLVL